MSIHKTPRKGKKVEEMVDDVFGDISDAETIRNGEKKTNVSPKENDDNSEAETKGKSKEELQKAVIFELVDEYTAAAKKMKRFEDYETRHIRYGVFLALPTGKVTKTDFAKKYNFVNPTLSERRLRDDVIDVRDYFLKAHFRTRTPEVVETLFKAASFVGPFGANTAAIKLFLQYIEEFSEKNQTDLNVSGGLTVQFSSVGQSPFINPIDSQPGEKKKQSEKPVHTVGKSGKTKKKAKPAGKSPKKKKSR